MTGFYKDKNSLNETRLQESIFARIRFYFSHPCMSAELLVFHQTQTKGSTTLATEVQTQQGFIDERTSKTDPSRTVDDDQDDEMSEPTQTETAERRKTDETAKELRAPLPLTTFSHASSTRLEDETHEQHTRFTIQARIARTGAEAHQDVSSMFLRARMVDVHEENKERMLMTKKGERKFYFAHRSSKMQGVFKKTRRAIRQTQMSYDTVVILADGTTRQLTGASREISPMQWVHTDEKTHLRGDNDYVRVLAKHKGRTTGHADPETTERLGVDRPADNADFHNIILQFGVRKLMSPFTHTISRMDISKHKKLTESRCTIF